MGWIEKIGEAFSSKNLAEITEQRSTKLIELYYQALLKRIPEGQVSPLDRKRPSVRLHGKTLKKSLSIRKNRLKLGFKAAVVLNHPTAKGPKGSIIDWLSKGTHEHPIFSKRWTNGSGSLLYFHWGNPLPWPPRDGRPPGKRSYIAVQHRGAKPNPFLEESFQDVKKELDAIGEAMVGDILKHV